MRNIFLPLFILAISPSFAQDSITWQQKKFSTYQLYYTREDSLKVPVLEYHLARGHALVKGFFGKDFTRSFDVYIFSNRKHLDEQWEDDWKQPGFKSECWMIASGVATRLDILSPKVWTSQACEHNGDDSVEVQQVITHEMVHVFHGQQNPSPAFDGMDDLSWLIEGLATHASGQLSEVKIKMVKEKFAAGLIPATLADVWKGKLRYQLAGTLIKFINEHYGRNKLFSILSLRSLSSILAVLATTEKELIRSWVDYYR